MKALTLWPEWAAAIAHLGKRVENRDWLPPRGLIGQRIAIHAGKNIGGRPGAVATEEGIETVWLNAPDTIVLGYSLTPPGFRIGARDIPIATSAIVATARLVGFNYDDDLPWAVPGAIHWILDEVRVLPEPVPCRGAQGLWVVPADVADRVGP